MTPRLDLTTDPVELTAALVDVPSVSGSEEQLADVVERALRTDAPGLEVVRSGNAVLARTNLGKRSRVVLAGHLDTVPINENLPVTRTGSGADEVLHGCGTVDMKGGDAVMLHLAATLDNPAHDLTFVFYDCEEVSADRNGLNRIESELPDWMDGDLAVVCEPSNAAVEAGCQGTLRVEVRTRGQRAHSARAWMGENAIHAAEPVLRRLSEHEPRTVDVDGLRFHEGLQAVGISGGVAGNVVPDECVVTVNHRFAPDTALEEAEERVRRIFDGFEVTVVDAARAAHPGLNESATAELVAASGAEPVAKLGWTDVARFAARGMPAVNFGPGSPTLAHTQQENVAAGDVRHCAEVLRRALATS
ncbi:MULTISPECIES: succinyl-diaminopimelate desuccinylase [unclassified Actinopolyspora]|uniref:succinyl-diaminopimelate desuccinylase n=1 Tax=unclassified Actinopolyspora TaxID=2639451 RepID=UPI0013F5F02B|nr:MULTISPECIES: succinyl-diaminopimelate desuccinylase [unclassified Actinopolyspora]NHD17926.1 succinyl-diaminopimelate desuccinylase [Actinopolyspora sp. BKK2]NHE77799.1 succinyl-diaminopimelate desuccinylase [Actinopolyspora sp. BKK1]